MQTRTSKKENFLSAIYSILVVLTLLTKWDIVFETGMTHPLADFVNRIANCYVFNKYTDVFIFFGVFYCIKAIRKYENRLHKPTLIVAAVFALTYICALSFMMYESMILIKRDWFQLLHSLFLWIGTTIGLYFLFRGVVYALSNTTLLKQETEDDNFIEKHLFVLSFATVALVWLLWCLCIYPGNCNIDAIFQLQQYFSGSVSNWTTHHPPFSTFIMGSLVTVGKVVFKSANFGFFLYLVIQTLVGAFIIAYGVLTLKNYFKIKLPVLVAIVLFFALVPFWGVYASLYEKSLFYSELAVLISIVLLPVVKDRTISDKRMFALTITCILTALLRNNGIYAIVPTLIALIVYLKGTDKKRACASLIAFLVITCSVNNILYPSLGITKGSIAEALSLPFQQTAKYVKYYGDDVTAEEREAIDAVLIYDSLPEAYDHNISNPVKDNYRKDNSKLPAYMKVWVTMFFKHPGIYFSAFIDSSYGYMAPVIQSIEATTDFDYESTGLQEFGLTHQLHVGGVELTNAIRTLSWTLPIIKYLCMPGLYTWLMVLALVVLIRRKQYAFTIVFIPPVINFLVCLASPLSASMRYSHPTVMVMPFLLAATIYYMQEDRNHLE